MEAGRHQQGHCGSNSVRCAGCKFLRRRCAQDCVLAPYFPASHPQRYADVHAVFGNSNVTRWLQSLPVHERGPAADAMVAEARWRVQDPVYGSAGVIQRLQQEIAAAEVDLVRLRAELVVTQQQPPPVHAGATTTQSTPRRQRQPVLPMPPAPARPAAAAARPRASYDLAAVMRAGGDDYDQATAPLMDLDGFLFGFDDAWQSL